MQEISIYVHIPFCERKCNYCAFASFCGNQEQIERYIDFLCREIEKRKCDKLVKTIYIGGGTPSILNEEQIERIVKTIYQNFNVDKSAEFTIEANPNSITENLLKKWKELRVNRVSVGVQSLCDKSLKKIGRLHDKKTAIEKIKLTRKYFDNVSADLIVGLENETGKDLCKNAKALLELGIKHISCYLLEIYENTKIYQMIKMGQYKPLDDETTIESFNKLANYLVDSGMERYEISNFCYPGYESKHNLNYWKRGEYLGFGLGAHSFENEERYYNLANFADYEQEKRKTEHLTDKEKIEEIIMLGLRCKIGVNLDKILSMGYDLQENEYYKDYIKQGILIEKDKNVYLNQTFYHLSNTIISNLLP